jgi:hypothetical protein
MRDGREPGGAWRPPPSRTPHHSRLRARALRTAIGVAHKRRGDDSVGARFGVFRTHRSPPAEGGADEVRGGEAATGLKAGGRPQARKVRTDPRDQSPRNPLEVPSHPQARPSSGPAVAAVATIQQYAAVATKVVAPIVQAADKPEVSTEAAGSAARRPRPGRRSKFRRPAAEWRGKPGSTLVGVGVREAGARSIQAVVRSVGRIAFPHRRAALAPSARHFILVR